MLIREWVLVAGTAMLTLVGCNGASDGPKTVKAAGVVTLDGAPVDGAQVVFIDDNSTYPAYGQTDATGKFSLQLSDEKKGAVPGSYKVQVSKTLMEQGKSAEGSVNLSHGLPKQYSSFLTSGLTFTVPDAGTSDIKLELKSK